MLAFRQQHARHHGGGLELTAVLLEQYCISTAALFPRRATDIATAVAT